jgi:hypothetical protein
MDVGGYPTFAAREAEGRFQAWMEKDSADEGFRGCGKTKFLEGDGLQAVHK